MIGTTLVFLPLAKDTVTDLDTVAHPTLYITVFKNEIPGLCCNTLSGKLI